MNVSRRHKYRTNFKSQPKGSKMHVLPHRNSMALRGRSCLWRAAVRGAVSSLNCLSVKAFARFDTPRNKVRRPATCSKTLPSPHRNSMALRDRPATSWPICSLWNADKWLKKNAKSSRQLEKHFSPRFNSMAVKDGRLRAAARLEGIRSPSEWSKEECQHHLPAWAFWTVKDLGKKHPLPL